ncbi:MAG: hypothetical protein IT546_07060 [Caulobacteraceae bacterium]|nr:hypothetical protein [Caulobacteraceae bacterium]
MIVPPPPAASQPVEDRVLPAIVYGLYLLGLVNGVTIVIGIIMAYVCRDRAAPRTETHYIFQIYTFWLSIFFWLIGWVLIIVGIPLSIVLIGIPALILGGVIVSVVSLWVAVRCIVGLLYVMQGEPYPRPRNWLI